MRILIAIHLSPELILILSTKGGTIILFQLVTYRKEDLIIEYDKPVSFTFISL